jgi:hypothetical protein
MLYTKLINKITYQDVINFCNEGHKEGFILEYKSEFPSNEVIAKTISAFANTYGGLLIIGVNAPDGKPLPPFEGIVFNPSFKYEEKIESIVLSHIKEPVFPEIQVCEPVNGKTFILIRVAESHLTPHRVFDNRRIYIRTGQSSMPNAEATWDKIEWLANRRKKSEEFRELLIEEGERYFHNACNLRGINPKDKEQYFATLSFRIIPLFPQEPLTSFKELDRIKNNITIRSRGGGHFPLNVYEYDAIQHGIHKLYIIGDDERQLSHGKAFEYLYLNSFGLYIYKRDIGEVEQVIKESDRVEGKKHIKALNFYWIPIRLREFLLSAILFYQELGYWGTVQLMVELYNALGVQIRPVSLNNVHGWFRDKVFLVPSDNLKWEKTTTIPFLKDQLEDILIELTEAAAWSLGIKYFTQEKIREYIKEKLGY